MSINNIIPKATNTLLSLFILCTVLPVKLNYSSISIILLMTLAIINFFINKGKLDCSKKYLVLVIIPFLVYSVGLINSTNVDYGLKFLTRNLSFIAFPIIFCSLNDWVNKKVLINTYLIGLFFVNLYLLYLFIYYFNFGARFYMIVTTDIYHSTYLGMYNLLAYWICISLYREFKNNLFLIFSLFFCASAIITSARIIFILAVCSLLITVIIMFKNKWKRFGVLGSILIISVLSFILTPSIKGKFHQLVEIDQIGFDKDNYGSISSRFGKFEASYNVIKDNLWFGTGTGDMTDELVKKYHDMEFTMGYKYRYNPHNQYLDNLTRNGLIGGGMCLIALYLLPFYFSIKNKQLLFTAFIVLTAGVSMTESILDVHKGITFYTFFLTLLLIHGKKSESSK